MTISLKFSEIKSKLSDNSLILTPNARTQQALFNGQMAETTVGKVITPHRILSFTQWQNELWTELSFRKTMPKLISKTVLKLWIEELIATEPDWNLTNESGVANKVVEAFQSSVAWNLSYEDIQKNDFGFGGNDQSQKNLELFTDNHQSSLEVSYFLKWLDQYNKIAASKNIICTFEMLKYIISSIDIKSQKPDENRLSQSLLSQKIIPSKILLVGFNQFTPIENEFFDTLRSVGVDIDSYHYTKNSKKTVVIEFDSFADEIDFAALSAKRLTQSDKNESVAIVVNQLSNNLTDVHAAFSSVFQPEENKPWETLSKPLYNVSAGFSIAEQSIVKAGYLLLNLRKGRLTLEELHFIKNTHYFQWGFEKEATQYFLHKLCLKGRKEYSLKFILSEIDKFVCDELLLNKLRERINALESKSIRIDLISNYQKKWKKTLNLWGWGVESETYSISVTDNDICLDYIKLINETNEINRLFVNVSEKVALQYLNQLATQKSFQLPSDRSRVHVLGVLEATGLQFDHLILVGFNSVNWPVNNKPNPFLPADLQRELKMPGGSAEREYEYTKSLSDILTNSADELTVTSSNENSDSKSSVSVFFADLSSVENDSISEIAIEIDNLKVLTPIAKYEWISNSSLTIDKERLHGGTSFLSDYASCPFNGFLAHYLKVTNFEVAEVGIDARHRGVWLHDTMQFIWQELKNQQNLLILDDDQLVKLIDDKLQSKLNEIKGVLLLNVNESIIKLEKEKLASLIFEWLLIEKERDNFSVESVEKEMTLNLQNIQFRFRLDRVDSNDQGKLEIIDYKTGKVQVNDWFSVRPTEAQMPAYMLTFTDDDISAIDYARIKKGEVAQVGLSFNDSSNKAELNDDERIIKFENYIDESNAIESKYTKLKEKSLSATNRFDREELKLQWQQTLDRIAYGMSQGFAPVSPKDINRSCTYCEYRSVCRIDERQPDLNNCELPIENKNKSIDLAQELEL